MGVLGAVYGASAIEEKQEKWGHSTAHLSPGLAGRAGQRERERARGKNERKGKGRVERG